MVKELTREQLLGLYNLVFSSVHSDGFKTSEMKDLLFDNEYRFLEKPNENWLENINKYFESNNIDKSILNINSIFTN